MSASCAGLTSSVTKVKALSSSTTTSPSTTSAWTRRGAGATRSRLALSSHVPLGGGFFGTGVARARETTVGARDKRRERRVVSVAFTRDGTSEHPGMSLGLSTKVGQMIIKRGAGSGRAVGGGGVAYAADVESGATEEDDGRAAPKPSDPPLEGAALMRRVLPAVLVASLGAFSFGYHLGVVNPALEHLARDLGIAAHAQMKGLVVSTILVGATVGSMGSGRVADDLGRKSALVACAAPLTAGSLLCACAPAVSIMLLGRFLAGLGIGAASNLVPMYVAEVSPEKLRGTLGSLNQLSICIGILVAVIAGLPLAGNPDWWHTMFLCAAVPGMLLGLLMTAVPESPGWLRSKGRVVEAQAAETALWGAPLPGAGDVKGDVEKEKDATLGDLFAPSNRRQITIGTALFFLQQMSGINAVIYFSSSMFEAAGVKSAVAASVAVCAINVFGTLCSGQALDRLGRKPLLIGSFVGMGVSCWIIAAAMSVQSTWSLAGPTAVAGTLAYMVFFGLGCGPIPGLLSSEIFSPKVRGNAMSLCLVTHWVFNFVIGQTFLPVVEAVGGPAVFVGFSVMCAVAVFFVKTQVLETKGKSLEVIQKEMMALNT